jgi:hypothetical protein
MEATASHLKGNGSAASGRSSAPPGLPSESSSRIRHIAIGAYYLAEQRGFAPGQEINDWLEAETEFDLRDGQ